MKSKGAIRFFAIALAIVCLYQISFTFLSYRINKKAEAYANGNEELKQRYLDSVSTKSYFNILVKNYTYRDVKERELNLGLDLRGGMYVTMEVATDKLLKELSGNTNDAIFNQALDYAKKESTTSQIPFIDLFYNKILELKPDIKLGTYFANLGNTDISFNSSSEEVLVYLKGTLESALKVTYDILRTRIDKFGVSQPNVSPNFDKGRITLELPGIKDPSRVRRLLKGAAKLEFYTTYTIAELESVITEADKIVYNLEFGSDEKEDTKESKTDSSTNVKDTTSTASNSLDALMSGESTDSATTSSDSTSKEDEKKNKTTPLIEKLFAYGAPQDGNSPVIGYVRASDTAKINTYFQLDEIKEILPPDLKLAWSAKPIDEKQAADAYYLVALKTTNIEEEPAVLTGDVIVDAKRDVDPQSNAYVVSMRMNSEGAVRWAQITKDNIGKSVAVVLDGGVYSFPNVNQEITGGNSQISGNFTAEEASDLATILKAGKLPVELNVINEAVVGASMGQQSINQGLLSLIAGTIAVILFMIFYYAKSGWVATLALLANLFFIIGVLTSLQAALTLPGMAGIVLTLAMAVDANVLIFERIREELRTGKGIKLAIQEGYNHAMSSIIDANITTLLVAIILMVFGSGPIYGFAIVLFIGILTSLFSAILLSRLIYDWLLDRDKQVNFGTKLTSSLFLNFNYNFIGKRKLFYIISGVIITAGVISLATQGLNYGVEFRGGHEIIVESDNTMIASEARVVLSEALDGKPEVKTFGADNKLRILTDYKLGETDDAINQAKEIVVSTLSAKYGKIDVISSDTVSSTVASDIKSSALWTIVFSLLVIFLYVVLRFRRWQFALGALIALIHDVMLVLSIFSIFKDILPFSDFDQALVAAVLTVLGYSINDTVVVFDRIRESLRLNKYAPMMETINSAINTTLSRTVITSVTVLIVSLILFFFGGETIRGFSFAMIIGVISGTYSSIYIATPIAVDFHSKEQLAGKLSQPKVKQTVKA
jgi:SecD/SecF fusion protein